MCYWWRDPKATEASRDDAEAADEESGSDGSGGSDSGSDDGSGESGGTYHSGDGGSDWSRSGSRSDDEGPSTREDPSSIPPSRMSSGSNAVSFIEESPEALQRHRDLYLSIYSRIDPQNAGITRYSHIFEALNIALHNPIHAQEIVDKLCRDFVFDSPHFNGVDLVDGLRTGDWVRSLRLEPKVPKEGKA
ncbi:hypothetical protein DXG03_008045 [Asterophora parasitica]|uniref:Uncharacterized protein n=1 Tax=Asterophora parasitica TaxID=117018 RepID=A0A9P7FXX3_9AGAR|nr:hypothetical protein DXG03_008045 [Asterophora parasitica]